MTGNLLLNPRFEFHAFMPHRNGTAGSSTSGNVAFWSAEAWGDIAVTRESHLPADARPESGVGNVVTIKPGKKFWQFLTLPEGGLAHGERVSLSAQGRQGTAGGLTARIVLLKLDSEDGTWSPAEFKMEDSRTFPRHARGELVAAKSYEARAEGVGAVTLKIEGAEIVGKVTAGTESRSADVNTIALRVEFENTSKADVAVHSPCLSRGDAAAAGLAPAREMTPYYRHIPRTMQKLWKGEPIHVVVMGSSIDRGSANPPLYPYDEDPKSPTFKRPLSDRSFDAKLAGRPELEGYVGWWQHYFSYGGRLRLELMRKFNLPVSRICLNVMACDGSCVAEAHSGLKEYLSLALPPSENGNGHKAGTTWAGLYPELFARAGGPGPDLVIFGSGANEKTDTPDEVAVFEGAIRWIQRRYPNTEFLFCMFQNTGGYTPNAVDLQALALRYQIPYLDYGKAGDDVTRWCNPHALVPKDGHPQAAAHYLWFKQVEKAFECWDPILPGQAQLQLPERAHPNSYGWEGDLVTYGPDSPRLKGDKFIFDDTAINCWIDAGEGPLKPFVDGENERLMARRKLSARDIRNSYFRHGRARLGDRHILEIEGPEVKLTAVDAKQCPERRVFGVEHPLWDLGGAKAGPFASEWGAPFGAAQAMLMPGGAFEIDVVATDVAVAWVDAPAGGTLRVTVDGVERLVQPGNRPFVDRQKKEWFIENRKGVLGLGFGLHRVRLEALEAPVAVLGVTTYDSRSNRASERRVIGRAAPGETVVFTPAFKAPPVVLCGAGLRALRETLTPERVSFTGELPGVFEAVGE
jgi:hypothetical protein